MLRPLKLRILTPPLITFSGNMTTFFHSLNANWLSILGRCQMRCLPGSLRITGKSMKRLWLHYADLKASIIDYYDENIAHRDHTDKLVEASMSSLDKSSNTISDLYKGLNIITELLKEIKNAVKDDSAHALKQDEELAAWAKSSTNMAWNLGSRLLGLERTQNHIQSSMSSLKEDTHSIKNMMIPKCDKGKGIATESDEDLSKRLVPASTIIRPNLDALIPYTINGEVYHVTAKQLQEQMDKEELIKKAEEEARLFAISKPEVLKKEHIKKVRISLELRKYKFKSYTWTINNILKPETITDIKIHPKTKPVVITVYRGTDGRNFDVHRPFAFGAFGISELDKFREIIPKKKNAIVHDLMNSLSQRYERIRKIPKELGIKSAHPAPALR
ncbi:hypothetical protein Tco_1103389 [Tanacetum coccineum]